MSALNYQKATRLVLKNNSNTLRAVLLACADKESENIIRQGLEETRYKVGQVNSIDVDLFSSLTANKWDILVMQVDSPDKAILEVLNNINEELAIPIVMFSTEARSYMVEEVVAAGVSAFVVNGLSAERIPFILDTAIARFNSVKSIKNELKKAKVTLAERKHIDKAKGLLMKHKSISEDEAYSMLRKMAMEGNKRIGQVAQEVTNVLEVLG